MHEPIAIRESLQRVLGCLRSRPGREMASAALRAGEAGSRKAVATFSGLTSFGGFIRADQLAQSLEAAAAGMECLASCCAALRRGRSVVFAESLSRVVGVLLHGPTQRCSRS